MNTIVYVSDEVGNFSVSSSAESANSGKVAEGSSDALNKTARGETSVKTGEATNKAGEAVIRMVNLDLGRGKKTAASSESVDSTEMPEAAAASDAESGQANERVEQAVQQVEQEQLQSQQEELQDQPVQQPETESWREKRARRKQERYENSWRGKRERAKQQEREERASWYENLKKAADAGKTGDWMSHEEKVGAGLIDDYRGVTSEEALIRDLRGDLDEEKGELWEVQRYEFKTPEDVRDFAKAAARVLHYEKNTVVGTQYLEVQFKSSDYETWENERTALLNAQWDWAKDVLADVPYKEKRDAQKVYLDYLEFLHESGNKRDSFVNYLERAVPECTIEPTKQNIRELREGKEDMREDLLTDKNMMDENYYSDEEISAILKMYDRASIMTSYAATMEEHKQQEAEKRRGHRGGGAQKKDEEREGVRSMVFGELKDSEKAEIIDFPEQETAIDDGYAKLDERKVPTSISVGNKSIDLNVAIPNEEGLAKMHELADYALARMQAAKKFEDERHQALAEKWENSYLTLLDNIAMVSIMLENKRADQVEAQNQELERRAVMADFMQKWNNYDAEQLVEQYSTQFNLDRDKPIVDQLERMQKEFQNGLEGAYKEKDLAGQVAYLSKIREINSILLSLGPDGTEVLQNSYKSANAIIA